MVPAQGGICPPGVKSGCQEVLEQVPPRRCLAVGTDSVTVTPPLPRLAGVSAGARLESWKLPGIVSS